MDGSDDDHESAAAVIDMCTPVPAPFSFGHDEMVRGRPRASHWRHLQHSIDPATLLACLHKKATLNLYGKWGDFNAITRLFWTRSGLTLATAVLLRFSMGGDPRHVAAAVQHSLLRVLGDPDRSVLSTSSFNQPLFIINKASLPSQDRQF